MIAQPELGNGTGKLRAVGLCPARHVTEYLRRSCGGEFRHLSRDTLAVCRYPCIAVNHPAITKQTYATKKLNRINRLILLHKF